MKKVALALLVVLLALLVGAYFYLNRIVESAIERGSEQALGVDTHVEAAALDLWTGQLGMDRFTAQNPPGTSRAAHFVSLQAGWVQVPLSALWRDTIRVPQITLDGLAFNLAQRGLRSNYQPILQHLDAFVASQDPTAGPTLLVDELRIREATVRLAVSAEVVNVPDIANIQATVPALRLENVGAEEGGVSIAHLTALVITSVLRTIAASEEALPEVIRQLLLAHLETLPGVPVQIEGDVAWSGTELGQDMEAALREQAEEVLQEGEALRNRVQDLLGRDTTD